MSIFLIPKELDGEISDWGELKPGPSPRILPRSHPEYGILPLFYANRKFNPRQWKFNKESVALSVVLCHP